MNMDKYLQLNYKTIRTKVLKVTKNHQNADDLLNDLIVNLLEKPKPYQEDLLKKNKVDHWFTSSAKIQFVSKTSPFYYKYKKFQHNSSELQVWKYAEEDTSDDLDVTKMREDIKSEIDLYNVYERTLLIEHLLNGKSYSEISREYKVNRRYISETITPCKKEIVIKLKKLWNK